MVAQQHKLKKRLRELKRLRTAVITGDEKKYTLEQVNDAIENVRVSLGTAEDRTVVVKYDLYEWQYLNAIGYTFEKFNTLVKSGMTCYQIARKWGVAVDTLKDYMNKKEEKEMAKLTAEQYKGYVLHGLTTKEIAEKTGLSEASVYQYKAKFKKAGLLDTPVEKVTVVNPSELDRLTQINADLGSQHELLKAKNAELVEKNRLLTEKLNVIAKCDEKATEIQQLKQQLHDAKTAHAHASDKNEELNEQMDELEEQYNALKERYATLQGIASGYENHEKELHEEIAYLKNELQTERYKHTQDDSLQQRYNSLVTIAKPVLKDYVDNL